MTDTHNPFPDFDDEVLNLGVTGSLTASMGLTLDELESEDVTLVAFLLDMSSSMAPVANDVIGAFNLEVTALARAQTATSVLVSTTTFADAPALLHGYAHVERVPPLTSAVYAPSGSTALYDACLGTLARLDAYRRTLRDNGVRPRSVVVVLSDGDDNASKHSAAEVCASATALVRDEATFLVYVGFGAASSDAALRRVAGSLGFPSVLTASQTGHEVRRALGQVSASLVRTSRNLAGPKAGASFF